MLCTGGQQRILKTLVIQDQFSQKVKILPLELPLFDQHISLREFLSEMLKDLPAKIIRTYDFQKDAFMIISAPTYLLPLTALHPSNVILLRMAAPSGVALSSNPSTITSHEQGEEKSETSSLKKERSKERVIFEVIEIVKRWREIHQSKNNIKKVSLQQAAKIVGLPKKSLDDYYYQLRLGQKYDFDFRSHLFDRIGVLRTYLKNLKDHFKLDKNEKHPKKLKIIDDFDQISELFYRNRHHQMSNDPMDQEDVEEDDGQLDCMNMEADDINEEESKGIQNKFYSEFEYLLNEKDPFLACDYNFKKKGLEEGIQEGDLFF